MLKRLYILLLLLSPNLKGFAQVDNQLDALRKNKVRSLKVAKDESYKFKHLGNELRVDANYMGNALLTSYYLNESGLPDSSFSINLTLMMYRGEKGSFIRYYYNTSGKLIRLSRFQDGLEDMREVYTPNSDGSQDTLIIYNKKSEKLLGTEIRDTLGLYEKFVLSYDSWGRLKEKYQIYLKQYREVTRTYTYDAEGRLVEELFWGNTRLSCIADMDEKYTTRIQYSYYPNGLIDKVTYTNYYQYKDKKPRRKGKYTFKYKYTYYP